MLSSLTVTPYQDLSYVNKRKSPNVVGSYLFLLSSLPPAPPFPWTVCSCKIPEINYIYLSESLEKLARALIIQKNCCTLKVFAL
jgi:hypothetical protein